MKLLIVDDEISALFVFLNEIIHESGLEYKFFQDNEEAILKYVTNNHIDSAFLDIRMPNIDGISLAKKILKIKPKTKIVFITGLTITINDIDKNIKNNVVGFIYKPYSKEDVSKIIRTLSNEIKKMKVNMFDTFDCYINNERILFSSSKAKELFALLLVYRERGLTMYDAISQLWPDHDLEKSKKLYRDAVWRLHKTLKEIDFECVVSNRGELSLISKNIDCDYWNFLDGKDLTAFKGEFLKSYDWSIYYLSYLEEIQEARK